MSRDSVPAQPLQGRGCPLTPPPALTLGFGARLSWRGREAEGQSAGPRRPPQRPPVLPFALSGSSLDAPLTGTSLSLAWRRGPGLGRVPRSRGQTLVAASPGTGCLVSLGGSGWQPRPLPRPPCLSLSGGRGTRRQAALGDDGPSAQPRLRRSQSTAGDSVTMEEPAPRGPRAEARHPRTPRPRAQPASSNHGCVFLSLCFYSQQSLAHCEEELSFCFS